MKKNYYAAIMLLAAVFILPFHSHAEENNNKIAESPENPSSIIREDLVWEYIDKVDPSAVDYNPNKPCLLFYYFFRFKGKTEINGVTYHNLYCRWANELQEMNRENHADDFDFNSVPDFYVRQEGSKYYMLRNNVVNYVQDKFSGYAGYGSETVESVIYDFSTIPEDSSERYRYEICTGRLENGEYPDDYDTQLFYGEKNNPNTVWGYSSYKLPEDLNPGSPDSELLLQKTSLFDAFVDYGAINGSLGMPGTFHGAGLSCGVYLNKIYTLDGKVKLALPPRYTSDLSGINNVQSDNSGLGVSAEDGRIVIRGAGGNPVRIFSMDGTKVYEGPAGNVPVPDKGVYIVRCGSETAKIAL